MADDDKRTIGIWSVLAFPFLAIYVVGALALAGFALFLLAGLLVALAPAEGWAALGSFEQFFEALDAFGDRVSEDLGQSATVVLALIAGALSVPIVIYRAGQQKRGVDATLRQVESAAKNTADQIREARRASDAQLQEQQKAAERQELLQMRLRATEMLGAVKSETVGVDVPNLEARVAAISILEEVARTRDPFTNELRHHLPVLETLLAYLRATRQPLDIWSDFEERLPQFAGRISEDGVLCATAEAAAKDRRLRENADEAPAEERIAFAEARVAHARAKLADAKEPVDAAAIGTLLRRRSWGQLAVEHRLPEPSDKSDPEAEARIWPPNWETFDPEHQELDDNAPAELRIARGRAAGKFAWAWRDDDRWTREPDAGFPMADTALHRAALSGAKLRRLPLMHARLEGADLREARLERANLHEARLEGADLSWARLEGASLFEARLEGADLSGARLKGAYLTLARLEGADLGAARLDGANLSGARLEGADLSHARLEGAVLILARLEGADLSGARLEGANLIEARLEGAHLFQARLEGANLSEARLEGASLVGASILSRGDDQSVAATEDRRRHAEAKGLSPQLFAAVFGDERLFKQIRWLWPDAVKPKGWAGELGRFYDSEKAWAEWRAAKGYSVLPQHEKYAAEGDA